MDTAQAVEPTTKASRIMALAAEGHTTRVIAGIVYGLSDDNDPQYIWDRRTAYCRVVIRQRKGTGVSDIERRYARRKYGSLKAYRDHKNACTRDYRNAYYAEKRKDPKYRARLKVWQQTYYARKKAARARISTSAEPCESYS